MRSFYVIIGLVHYNIVAFMYTIIINNRNLFPNLLIN